MKKLYLYILLLITLICCNGQTNDLSKNFNTLSEYYFDKEQKIPMKFNLDKKGGGYSVYYIPKENQQKYYTNFLKTNNINPIEDEYNDTYSYSEKDRKKINLLLKNKLVDEQNYDIIGQYIAPQYFKYEDNDNYTVDFPYTIKFYKKEDNKWLFIKEISIKNYNDDMAYSKKEFIKSLLVGTNISKNQNLNKEKRQTVDLLENWKGKYSLILNENSDDWRNIHEISLIISNDSITYSAEGFQLYEYYMLKSSTKDSHSLILNYLKALDDTENERHLQKSKDFGAITFDGKNYIWESPYIDLNFNDGKKRKYIIKKSQ
ncbi:hypothetical protein [Chryseobacterium sp. MMS23-Vi53]|uniref:hypothetical protein n=1 Tax=Chryseobacterium sp. MMS23-Vi53 TaxID=3386644 RepID=UPI0039E89AAD